MSEVKTNWAVLEEITADEMNTLGGHVNDRLEIEMLFGDGSDGDVDVNSGSFTSGSLITSNVLQRDAYFNNLTLSGGDLDMNGYRIFVRGTLTRDDGYKIFRNGNNGSDGQNGDNGIGESNSGGDGGSGGSGLTDGTLKGSQAGGDGGNGGDGAFLNGAAGDAGENGSDAVTASHCIGLSLKAGVNGGVGGSGVGTGDQTGGGAAGTGGGSANVTDAITKPRIVTELWKMLDLVGATLSQLVNTGTPAGSGGGGGGGLSKDNEDDGAGGGGAGGGGSDAGICFLAALNIVLNGTGVWLEAKGGDGGDGGNGGNGYIDYSYPPDYYCTGSGGGGGGGNGGNGGSGVLMYKTKTGSATIDMSGGNGGTGEVKELWNMA